ncbi:MAG: energy transducer TonB [Planctomycetes bacterium]|nr:energy transducer TonB [Planctomycetota bacterium]
MPAAPATPLEAVVSMVAAPAGSTGPGIVEKETSAGFNSVPEAAALTAADFLGGPGPSSQANDLSTEQPQSGGRPREERGGPAGGAEGRASMPARPRSGNILPTYPLEARRKGLEGKLVLEVKVLPTGEVGSVAVRESSRQLDLDRAAVRTVKGWLFDPALEGGNPVESVVFLPVVFRLEPE